MQKVKSKIPFWLQITLIVFCGVAASAVIAISADFKKTEVKNDKLLQNGSAAEHTVVFMDNDGKIIKEVSVKHGRGVIPPEIEHNGVFRGWSTALNEVNADLYTTPRIYHIVESNLFYFDTVYVKEGETFTLDINLGGAVGISSGTLSIKYDPDVMTLNNASPIEDCIITEEKKGEIVISFDKEDPIVKKTVLAKLRFKALERDAYYSEVLLSAKETKIIKDGQEKPADCATINNKIYFLQEVE